MISRQKNEINFLKERKLWFPVFGLALSGVAINNTIFYAGLERTNAATASLIVSFTPLTTMVFATILLKEKFTSRKILSVILGVIGVSIIIDITGGKLAGNLLILLAITIWGSSFSFSKMASEQGLSSIEITGWSQIVGTLVLVPFVANNNTISKYEHMNSEAIFWFVYMGILASVIAYVLHYQAIAILGAGKVAPTTNIIPFSGAVTAWFLLGDELRQSTLLGAVIVIIGILIVQLEAMDK
jgi:drug/metabolite transporter (DMT)-like permease